MQKNKSKRARVLETVFLQIMYYFEVFFVIYFRGNTL
jgi:hypothetical protein